MREYLATVITVYLVTLAGGVVAVACNHWFGSGDLVVYAIFCVPFSLAAGAMATALLRATMKMRVWVAELTGFVCGLLFGFLGTLALAMSLGPWMGAMSVPVLQVWCGSAAFTFAAGIILRRRACSKRVFVGVAVVAVSSVFVCVGLHPALSLLTGDQRLSIVELRYSPGDGELRFFGKESFFTAADLELLRKAGLRGTIDRASLSENYTTTWPRAKLLLVFSGQPLVEASLPQPKRCTIAYIQGADGFRRVPEDAPTLERQVRIEHDANGWGLWVDHASGSTGSSL